MLFGLSKTLIYNISSGMTELYMAAHFDVIAIFNFLAQVPCKRVTCWSGWQQEPGYRH